MNPESEHTGKFDLDEYDKLEKGFYPLKRKGSTSTKYRCPFCWNQYCYSLSDLRKHAAGIKGDTGKKAEDRAKHSALERYIGSLAVKTGQNKSAVVKTSLNIAENQSSDVICAGDELFVWPWKVILANNVEKFDPERSKYVRKSDDEIKEELLLKGFKPLKVIVLWNNEGQTPLAIVEFGLEWDDFHNAVRLERRFQDEHYGKKDYLKFKNQYKGDRLYGWMARVGDFENFEDEFGRYL
ncbi:gene X-like protein [Trifolium medium]|uniref:Gene X-like protein n=1 Tax=Trifolium medium TaxID=97028 RepID=A0A392MBP0_9FABA|nr:gene X-like protein [Trifolium medium]